MDPDPQEPSGGNGGDTPDEVVRADISLAERALRNDWPMSPAARKQLLQTMFGIATESKFQRNKIAAAKVIALYMRLNLGQQALDFARDKARGGDEEFNLAELVGEAEKIATAHVAASRPKELPKP